MVAVTDGQLIEVERDGLLGFIEKHPSAGAKLQLFLLREIARRVRASDDQLGDALLLNWLIGK